MMLMTMDCSSAPGVNSIIRESKNGIMDDEQHGLLVVDDDNDNDNSKKNSCVSDLSDVSSSVVSSDDSDLFEGEVNSTESSSSPGSGSSPTAGAGAGSLQDMSSLLQELPFKRGLSKHYNGKSQSFTSLSNVRCLEDLAKPENPYNKKLKSCRSYGGLMLESRHGSSRLISSKKATTRGSCSSLCVRRNPSTGFLGSNRPPPVPPPPHRSSSRSNFTTQTPLFALGV